MEQRHSSIGADPYAGRRASTPASVVSVISSTTGPTPAPPSASSTTSNDSQRATAVHRSAMMMMPVPPVDKMSMASVVSPMPQASVPSPSPMPMPIQPLSMTSKEWVVPPRPKPGRKPATDTPPTKRKAQNRAAQRAFRERRAARVGELEDQLVEQRVITTKTVAELEQMVQSLTTERDSLLQRCSILDDIIQRDREERGRLNAELAALKSQWSQHSHQPRRGTAAAAAGAQSSSRQSTSSPRIPKASIKPDPVHTGKRASSQAFSISQIISPPDDARNVLGCDSCGQKGRCACAEEVLGVTSMGCGRCSLGSKCACLEESIQSLAAPDLKRQPSPSLIGPDEKRQRHRSDTASGMETDFTTMDSSQKHTSITASSRTSNTSAESHLLSIEAVAEPKDPCGFCKDGTYCVCADSAPVTTIGLSSSIVATAGPSVPVPEVEPPIPMEITATGAVKLSSARRFEHARRGVTPAPAKASSCGPGGPGTCAQCLADPKSGLFCRLIARTIETTESSTMSSTTASSNSSNGACCGNGGPNGCCKSSNSSSTASVPSSKPLRQLAPKKTLGLSLTCADAYKTIASHRHFDQAADDIVNWLPMLNAAPARPNDNGEDSSEAKSRRAPIEVEAASIMSVLKELDVRFGK